MGSVSLNIGDGTARFKRSTLCSSAINFIMLFSIVTTNLFALYAFSSRSQSHIQQHPLHSNKVSLVSQHLSLILREIDSSQRQLSQMEKQMIGYEDLDFSHTDIPQELKVFLQHHQLPLAKDSRNGITEMVASIGHSCEKSLDLLSRYMAYNAFDKCPDDWSLAQRLILRGCEPLPRRRCLAKTVHKPGLALFPESLWRPISNNSVNWSGLGCKSFECLKGKKLSRDCVGCFEIGTSYEKDRFVKVKEKNDFLIDDVLGLGDGKIRMGFDISGGSGTFAAKMAEKNVNIISNTLNIEAPFSEFIAARGLFPLFMSMDQRLPFYDNVFDLIHASNGLDSVSSSNKPEKLEFLMFDLDRILKPGGLFWLDNIYCGSDGKKRDLTRLIERFGYKKLKWVVGEKADAEIYLSAVLQKPARI
ncbi:unnamed protein product [Arabis nemorensis]|uniref:Methyltransferase type 11 domain-containing protein n=1 Tax=Arabis nemorensis TaxID=586526 RepID=A0A565C722_9BRAS|nr:unnamed protein product [Arabis nemorensis]